MVPKVNFKENAKKLESKHTIDILDSQKVPLNNKNVFNIKSPKNSSAIKDLVNITPGIQTDVRNKVSNHFAKAFNTSRPANFSDLGSINSSLAFSPKKHIVDAQEMGPPESQSTSKKRFNRNIFENPIYKSSQNGI